MADDSNADLPYVSARDWVDVVSRIRLDTAKVNGPKVAARTVKAVAWRIAWFADGLDGTRVFPGPARLAVVCELDYKTVKRTYAVLRALALLTQVAYGRGPQGSRPRKADEYRLTIPPDLLDRVTVLSPLELDREIELVREANRAIQTTGVRGTPVPRNSHTAPVDNSELRGTECPATSERDRRVAGHWSPDDHELRGTGVPSCGVLESAIPTRDQITKNTDHDRLPAQPPERHQVEPPNGLSELPIEDVIRLVTDVQIKQPDVYSRLWNQAKAELGDLAAIDGWNDVFRLTWRLYGQEVITSAT